MKGVATVQNLLIQENTAGKDGPEYLLNFSAQIPANASPHPIPPFTLASYSTMVRCFSYFKRTGFLISSFFVFLPPPPAGLEIWRDILQYEGMNT